MSGSVWQAPLEEFQAAVAAPRPAPAGVAAAAVSAALGLSLLVKVLRIRGVLPEVLEAALSLSGELQAAADADIAAVRAYIETRETQGLTESPREVARAILRAQELCTQAAPAVTGLIAADIAAARALLDGAAAAVDACIQANAR